MTSALTDRLERLLRFLHPAQCIDPWHRRADEALATFEWPTAPITTLARFANPLVLLHLHVETSLLELKQPLRLNAGFTWGLVCKTLQKIYGPAGHVAAFEIASASVEGGFRGVSRELTHEMAEDYATRHIRMAVNGFLSVLSASGRLAAGDLVLSKLADLLPSGLAKGGAVRIRADLSAFLQEYPRLLQRLEKRLPAP